MTSKEKLNLKQRRNAERAVRAKAWYWFNAEQLSARSPGHLERLLGLPEEARTLENQCAGKHCPSTHLVDKAENLVPGGQLMLTRGPQRLFDAMYGTDASCWGVATVLNEDGRTEWIGRSIGLEKSVTRLCQMVAEDYEAGEPHHMARFAQLVALLHLQAETQYAVFPWHTEGTFELMSLMLRAESPVGMLLKRLHIQEEVSAWARAKQLHRIATNHNLSIGFSASGLPDVTAAIRIHLDEPLMFALCFETLRDRHPYLDAMPQTLLRHSAHLGVS